MEFIRAEATEILIKSRRLPTVRRLAKVESLEERAGFPICLIAFALKRLNVVREITPHICEQLSILGLT